MRKVKPKKISSSKDLKKIDLQTEDRSAGWVYSEKVKEHFFHPKNLMLTDDPKFKYNALGIFGSPACGDIMKIWLEVDPKTEKIKECRWRTFGCASAIAATSAMSEMVRGMKLERALKITPADILNELGGLPSRKIHCSVLGDQALREAIFDYYRKTGQPVSPSVSAGASPDGSQGGKNKIKGNDEKEK